MKVSSKEALVDAKVLCNVIIASKNRHRILLEIRFSEVIRLSGITFSCHTIMKPSMGIWYGMIDNNYYSSPVVTLQILANEPTRSQQAKKNAYFSVLPTV